MKIKNNVEWSLQNEKIMVVKPSTKKVYNGNQSILMVLKKIMYKQPKNMEELYDLVLGDIKYNQEDVDTIKKDIRDIVNFFVEEEIIEI